MKWVGLAVVLALVGFAGFYALGGLSAVSGVPGCGEMDVIRGTIGLFEETPLAEIEDLAEIDLLYPTETGFQWRQPAKRFCRSLLYSKHEQKGSLYYAVSWQHKSMKVFFLEILGSENEGMHR